MKTRYLLLLVFVGLLMSGCGFVFNQPLVGPDGTTALFVGDDGTYSMLPEGDCHLALLRDGEIVHLNNVASDGDSGVLDWSADGSEVLFMDTEQDEYGQPIAWNVRLSGVQSDSQPVTLFRAEDLILAPAFTKSGNITYLWAQDDSDLPQLTLYDRTEGTHTVFQDGVISYRRITGDGMLAIISETAEGSLNLAHVSSYDLATGEVEEVASFFLAEGMEETLFLLPASFLWDVAPAAKYIAISLYDQALITPQMGDGDDEPTLYLIDVNEMSAHKVVDYGFIPAFSPDGSALCYVGPRKAGDDTPVIYSYDLDTQESRMLDGTIGAVTLFWIDDETLGFTLESGDDTYAIMKISLSTGRVTPFLPAM